MRGAVVSDVAGSGFMGFRTGLATRRVRRFIIIIILLPFNEYVD